MMIEVPRIRPTRAGLLLSAWVALRPTITVRPTPIIISAVDERASLRELVGCAKIYADFLMTFAG